MVKTKAKWQEQKGVRADIAAVEFYAPEARAIRWARDARKLGKSRSKYIQELISAGEELFKVNAEPINYTASDDLGKLQARIKTLELQLIQERQRTAQLTVTLEGLTDEMILETLTSKRFTGVDTIIQNVINKHFGPVIIEPIMATLYRLAEHEQAEYSHKLNGWRLKV